MQHEGVEDVRILNGGFEAWKNAGFEIETGSNPKKPVTDFGKPTPAHPEYIIDMPEAKELLKDPNGCLVSIRSWAEQIGETGGYSYIKPKGRIPGDVWGHDIKDYRNIDQTMRNAAEIQAFWKEWGIVLLWLILFLFRMIIRKNNENLSRFAVLTLFGSAFALNLLMFYGKISSPAYPWIVLASLLFVIIQLTRLIYYYRFLSIR